MGTIWSAAKEPIVSLLWMHTLSGPSRILSQNKPYNISYCLYFLMVTWGRLVWCLDEGLCISLYSALYKIHSHPCAKTRASILSPHLKSRLFPTNSSRASGSRPRNRSSHCPGLANCRQAWISAIKTVLGNQRKPGPISITFWISLLLPEKQRDYDIWFL